MINNYLQNPLRYVFPYAECPMHEDQYGIFVNQLYKLNKEYLSIYSINNEQQFRKDYFFKKGNTIYDEEETPVPLMPSEYKEISLTELQSEIQKAILKFTFIYIVDNTGILHELKKENTEFFIPYAGTFICQENTKLQATKYCLQMLDEQKIAIVLQKLILNNTKKVAIEQTSTPLEPNIRKR